MPKKKKQRRSGPPPAPARGKPPRSASAPPGPTSKQRDRSSREAAQRRDALRRKVVTAGLVAALVAGLALFVVLDRRGESELREALTSGSCEVDTEADPTAPAGQNHVPSPRYAVDPPAGGDHLASVTRAGVYAGSAVPSDGLLVHALEHGYVIAWHRPDLTAQQKEQLAAFQRRHDDDVLVVERASLPVPVAVTAWEQRLLCQQVEPETFDRFFDEHVGNGPEDVTRG